MKYSIPTFNALHASHLLCCGYVYWSVPHPAFLSSAFSQALATLSQEAGLLHDI